MRIQPIGPDCFYGDQISCRSCWGMSLVLQVDYCIDDAVAGFAQPSSWQQLVDANSEPLSPKREVHSQNNHYGQTVHQAVDQVHLCDIPSCLWCRTHPRKSAPAFHQETAGPLQWVALSFMRLVSQLETPSRRLFCKYSAAVLFQVNFIGRFVEAIISEGDDREQAKGDCSEDRFHLLSPRFQVKSLHIRVHLCVRPCWR